MTAIQAEIQFRIVEAAKGHKIGSAAARHAVREVLDLAYIDGFLTMPPEWLSDFHVQLYYFGGECCITFEQVH